MRSTPNLRRVLIVTDAWHPQVNGVVRTLRNTKRELELLGHHVQLLTPDEFRTVPCPSYPEIRLSIATSRDLERRIEAMRPDALHIATEGPLGWAARNAAVKRDWSFTTAYHTQFPEYVHARTRLPLSWSYAVLRKFHAPSSAVLVPTQTIIEKLRARRFGQLAHWGRGVDHQIFFPRIKQSTPDPKNPVFLYAGRLAIEKNIHAFLNLDLPGEKWVAGDGPLEKELKRAYKNVRWIGMVSQYELADIYSRADVFVFPSKTDTFGLVMAEAMACGLPVAAYPVEGPLDVVGQCGAGVLSDDLEDACRRALQVPRHAAIARAQTFTWATATRQFSQALSPMQCPSITPHLHLATKGSL